MRISSGKVVLMCGVTVMIAVPNAVYAQQRTFSLPAEAATKSVPEFARQAGVQIIAPGEKLRHVNTRALNGQRDVRAALTVLLDGTGLHVVADDGRTITLAAADVQAAALPDPENGPGTADPAPQAVSDVIVTGTRIRGRANASPVTEVTSKDIDRSGYIDLGQVIRSLPQNFSGGQNPGLGIGSGSSANQNDTGGSAFNLRGLGPDATLTLLNGHRVSYDGIAQSVDASAIPVAALDRIEIVTDGASAIYGSDAVGGVANIILKRDFQGVTASGLVGGTTEGGQYTRQASITTGARWNSGGFILAYDFKNSAAIYGSQRDFTAYMDPQQTIYPALLQHSVVLAGHQTLIDGLEFNLDADFTRRRQESAYVTFGTAFTDRDHATVYTISPSLDAKFANDWSLSLRGVYGRDKGEIGTYYTAGGVPQSAASCYCNDTKSVELDTEGPLFHLPAGDVRVALGAGYRQIGYEDTSNSDITTHLSDHYLFGEASIPIVSPAMAVRGIYNLTASAALRYEDYPQFGQVATPKFGLVYEPTPDLSIKGTWSRSFKAPTAAQLTTPAYGLLYDAKAVGGTGYPVRRR